MSILGNFKRLFFFYLQAMENGLNYVAVVFAMQLCRLFLIEEKQNSPISDTDLQNTLDVLNKINTMSRGAAPGG